MNPSVVKLGSIKETDNAIGINWSITNNCNYRCSYCTYCSEENLQVNVDVVEFCLYAAKRKKLELMLWGGEPTMVPNFLDILNKLYVNNISLYIITNLSKPVSYLKDLNKLAYIEASWHGDYSTDDNYCSKVLSLDNVGCQIMVEPDKLDRVVSVYDFLCDKVKTEFKFINNVTYTNSELKPIYDRILRYGKNINDIPITFEDGSVEFKSSNNIVSLGYNQFKNWYCVAGKMNLDIDASGNVAVCEEYLNKKKYLFNVSSRFKLPESGIICECDSCTCEMALPKKRIFK